MDVDSELIRIGKRLELLEKRPKTAGGQSAQDLAEVERFAEGWNKRFEALETRLGSIEHALGIKGPVLNAIGTLEARVGRIEEAVKTATEADQGLRDELKTVKNQVEQIGARPLVVPQPAG